MYNRLADFLHKKFKFDSHYFLKGGSWLVLGYGIQIVTGLVLTVFLANSLSQTAYGKYQFIIAMSGFISIFTLTGVGTAISYHAARGTAGALRYGFRTQMLWNLGIVGISLALSAYYWWMEDMSLSTAFILVALFQPFIISFALYKVHLQAVQRIEESTIIDIIQRLFPFISLLTALLFTRDPVGLMSVFLISQTLSLGCAYHYTVTKHKLPITPDLELRKYSKHLSLMESFMQGALAIDKIVVWMLLGAAPVAVYSLAYMPVTHLYIIFGFVRQLAFPKLANQKLIILRLSLPKKIKIFLFSSIAAVGAYILAAPFIFKVLFPAYIEAVLYSQVLSLAILAVPFTLIKQTFAAHQMTRELYTINITTALVRIIVAVSGVWFFGIWGVVLSIIVSEYYSSLLQIILFRKIPKVERNALLE